MTPSLQIDLATMDTQRIGRMGELVVELELLARGWLVGNFNATTANSAGWDLFATSGRRNVRVRVKSKRPGVATFRWSAKADGTIFLNLNPEADDDFVAAVSFEADAPPSVYVIPTCVVEEALMRNHATWLSGPRRGGGRRADTSMRNLHLYERTDLGPSHGYRRRWAAFQGAWSRLLDLPSGPLPGDVGAAAAATWRPL